MKGLEEVGDTLGSNEGTYADFKERHVAELQP